MSVHSGVRGSSVPHTFPFVWMSVMKNHCLEHNYFVYRILAVSWFSLILMLAVFRKDPDRSE